MTTWENWLRRPRADQFRPNFWPNTPDILDGVLRNGSRAAFQLRAGAGRAPLAELGGLQRI